MPTTTIPDKFLPVLMHKKAFAHLATLMPDGTPQVTPVWFDYVGGKVRVNTAKGRVKARTMTEGAKVARAIVDPDNDYRYIQIRGVVSKVTEEGADAHIDALAKKYLGKDKYPWASPDQVRVIMEIEPQATQAMG
jgi:PPOX class probable F420-dependent enzyme